MQQYLHQRSLLESSRPRREVGSHGPAKRQPLSSVAARLAIANPAVAPGGSARLGVVAGIVAASFGVRVSGRRGRASRQQMAAVAVPEALKQRSKVSTDGSTASVGRLVIDPACFEGFEKSWSSTFAGDPSPAVTWHPDVKPSETHEVIVNSFKHAVQWLPEEVLSELMRFAYDPAAPPALWISGLPVDKFVPPTPTLHRGEAGLSAAGSEHRLPVCDTWVLGLARILGTPYRLSCYDKGNARGGLVRDMVPKPGLDGKVADLGLHRDLPSGVSRLPFEPDAFLLLGARGDTRHCVHTLVCSNKVILSRLTPEERAALRRTPVQVRFRRVSDGHVENYGHPYYALEGPDHEPKITLHGFVSEPGDLEVGEVVSEAPDTEAAYKRAQEVAWESCDRVDMQTGDVLFLNNARCNHGRCGYTPRMDGEDRWLVKTFIHCGGWGRPSQLAGDEPFLWPDLWPVTDRQ